MTRELKFRAWDKKERKMFYDDFQELGGWEPFSVAVRVSLKGQLLFYGQDDSGKSGLYEHELSRNQEADRFSLMQFVGLKDKNGKEIYEGDIIKFSRYWSDHFCKDTTSIFWFNWCARFEFDHNEVRQYDLKTICNESEVVGSVYENPELLQEEK